MARTDFVLYDIDKTKAIWFLEAQPKDLKDQVLSEKIKIRRQTMTFIKKIT